MKAKAMLGLGTVLGRDMIRISNAGIEGERVRKEVVHDILKGHLDFNEEELIELNVRETHMGKEDFIYFAAGNPDMLREIHVRKAESQNDKTEDQETLFHHSCFKGSEPLTECAQLRGRKK